MLRATISLTLVNISSTNTVDVASTSVGTGVGMILATLTSIEFSRRARRAWSIAMFERHLQPYRAADSLSVTSGRGADLRPSEAATLRIAEPVRSPASVLRVYF
jgi:hypothetical protein